MCMWLSVRVCLTLPLQNDMGVEDPSEEFSVFMSVKYIH